MGQWDQNGQPGYYICDADGATRGPYAPHDLPALGLQGDSLVWCEGMTEWTPALRVPAISAYVLQNRRAGPAVSAPRPPSSASPSTDRIWTAHDQGRQLGPHTLTEIAMLVGAGTISTAAMVWKAGDPQWQPVLSVVPAPAAPMGYAQPYPQQAYASASAAPVSTNRVAAGICGIVVGGLGIHKFILGYPTAGIIMLLVTLCTCGWGWFAMGIIGFIEGIIYLTKDDAQFHREYVLRRKEWF